MIHVHQSFNAVGHGTFFNGLAIDGKSNCAFSWIYDCGSKRTTRIEQELSFLEAWGKWPKEIDLLVLSHFDNDHVNGVERLLRSRRVRTLALPYMDVGQSLAYAASIGTDPCSISTATFQLNPIDWLQARGLAGQVDTLLLVQGGPHDNNDIPFEGEPVPLIGGPESNQIKRDSRIDTDATTTFPGVSATIPSGNTTTVPRLAFWKHSVAAIAYGIPLEIMFFNSTQPTLFRKDANGDLLARRSRKTTTVVQADIDFVVNKYRLQDLSRSPKKGWRDALRAVYVKHFGNSGQQRNNISLCLSIRPLGGKAECCRIFSDRDICCPTSRCRVSIIERAGTLLLGDLRIDNTTLDEMHTHFGAVRWADIGTVQVPHHGSQHSWEPGVAAVFGPERFIHCIPDVSTDHPHKSVNDDLRGTDVLRADYRTGVVIDYHFPLFSVP
ncbi:MBL fold metallo-hydrolase [Serratia nevei]|uniref:MBL fold metallo-hydrolase n=1 Tax=Serratia nevei TaxID=2703794 RepID=UPI00249B74F5|nr:MBL fold metallo-hydrolase [Serratia nevei]MDI3150067.1 hypothetical protein [Serratia nevei]